MPRDAVAAVDTETDDSAGDSKLPEPPRPTYNSMSDVARSLISAMKSDRQVSSAFPVMLPLAGLCAAISRGGGTTSEATLDFLLDATLGGRLRDAECMEWGDTSTREPAGGGFTRGAARQSYARPQFPHRFFMDVLEVGQHTTNSTACHTLCMTETTTLKTSEQKSQRQGALILAQTLSW